MGLAMRTVADDWSHAVRNVGWETEGKVTAARGRAVMTSEIVSEGKHRL